MPILTISDAELLHTAGLDAFIFHRAFTWGLLFLGPVTVLAMVLCKQITASYTCMTQCSAGASLLQIVPLK